MADEPETNDVDRTKKKIGRAWKLMDTLWCMGGHIGGENWEKVKAKGCWLRGNGDVIFDSNTPVEEIKPFLDMVGGYGSLKGFEWREANIGLRLEMKNCGELYPLSCPFSTMTSPPLPPCLTAILPPSQTSL